MRAKEIPLLWAERELERQQDRLEKLEMSGLENVTGYSELVAMRQQLVYVCQQTVNKLTP